MRRRLALVLRGALLAVPVTIALLATPAWAAELGRPVLTEAQAAMLTDERGTVLYSLNDDAQINMASITKVMTAVVALESGTDLDATYQLSDPTDMPSAAVVAGYHAGMTSTLRDLLRVMLVHSANDAAYEVAVICGGSEEAFVQKMNDKAAELGMGDTHFVNPHGLDADGHHSSVRDLTLLGRYAMQNHPFIAQTVQLRSVTVPVGETRISFDTSDALLDTYDGMLGIKTGAGNTVTSFLGSARRDGTTLYTCVLGTKTMAGRFSDTRALLDWAFGSYRKITLASPGVGARLVPFAYHFGLSCVVAPAADTTGLAWPSGTVLTWERRGIAPTTLAVPGEVRGTEQWVQDGRVIGTATLVATGTLVPSYSGFGPLDQTAHVRERG